MEYQPLLREWKLARIAWVCSKDAFPDFDDVVSLNAIAQLRTDGKVFPVLAETPDLYPVLAAGRGQAAGARQCLNDRHVRIDAILAGVLDLTVDGKLFRARNQQGI